MANEANVTIDCHWTYNIIKNMSVMIVKLIKMKLDLDWFLIM